MIRFILPVILLVTFVEPVFAGRIPVGEKEKLKTIQSALDIAQPFDTILVQEGIYQEHSLRIGIPLTLLTEGKVVIDAENQPVDILLIAADSVTIEGFELKNVGVSYLKEIAAVKLRRVRDIIIRNNTITNCYFGIYLEYSSYTKIEKNQIIGQSESEASAGNAIHAWKGDHLEIANNLVKGHRDGIYFEFVDNSIIRKNKSINNLRYGLHFMFSNDDEYLENEFNSNGAGVAVMFSKRIIMRNNRFVYNWGGSSYGLLLKEISDGEITGNAFYQNTIGILAEGANRLTISGNEFLRNGTAINIKGNCLDNQIVENNFLTNTFEVVTNTRYNTNFYERNYWSGYSGYDLNRDDIGDFPYRPVNLFSKITNEIPAASLMLHSFFVNILELGEKIFPQLIPAELVDEKPLMKPYGYD